IFASVNTAALLERALAGDQRAREVVRLLLPRDPPSRVARTVRDALIAEAGAWLLAIGAASSIHAVGQMIVASARQSDRVLGPVPPFDRLSSAERIALRRRVVEIRDW